MADGALSFEDDIKSLFREKDRAAMEWSFDLWSYEAVKENAEAVLERLQDGDMPCDGEWADVHVETFRRWMAEGMAP